MASSLLTGSVCFT